jgi:hypothetical protein
LLRQSTRERPKRSNFQTSKISNFRAPASSMRRLSPGLLALAPLITSGYVSMISQPWRVAYSRRSRSWSSGFWSLWIPWYRCGPHRRAPASAETVDRKPGRSPEGHSAAKVRNASSVGRQEFSVLSDLTLGLQTRPPPSCR